MNRQNFYTVVRQHFGKLKQSQVDGFEAILDEWDAWVMIDLRWLAYMLATVWHETAATMQPIMEYGRGKGRAYGKPHPKTGLIYCGRGLVQITWYENYLKMGKILGIPLAENPDLALKMDVAVKILFEGMTRGSFTGKHLGNYFNKTKEDWIGARAIINPKDCDLKISRYARTFHLALKGA